LCEKYLVYQRFLCFWQHQQPRWYCKCLKVFYKQSYIRGTKVSYFHFLSNYVIIVLHQKVCLLLSLIFFFASSSKTWTNPFPRLYFAQMSFGQSQTISDSVQYIFMTCTILTFLLNWARNRLFIIIIEVFCVVAVTQGQQQKPGSEKCSTKLCKG